ATVNGHALFGQNCNRTPPEGLTLRRFPGRVFSPGEYVPTRHVTLAQAKQTATVLGCQPPGTWGLQCGINEYHVALGCSSWRSSLACERPGLLATEIVRLALERSRGARQALDVLTDLLGRHGQAAASDGLSEEADSIFLIADPGEAFVVEAA